MAFVAYVRKPKNLAMAVHGEKLDIFSGNYSDSATFHFQISTLNNRSVMVFSG